jgi:tape measure domain-containing protein
MIAGSIEIQLLTNLARLQKDMDQAKGTVGRTMKSIESSARLATNALSAIVGGIGFRELAQAADSYTKLTAQLKLATRSAAEYATAYGNVQRIARSAQVDLNATASTYARLANSLRDLNVSQSKVADITESISLALRVNGATAAESASAMLQLSQAFGAGRLQGEEFRAVAEAAPGLLREVAKELRVNYGELKQLAADGKITSDVLAKAFTNPQYLDGLRQQVKEVQTISSAITVAKNTFTTLIGEMDKAGGASSSIANAIIWLADKMALLADIIYGAIEVFKQFGRSLAVVFNDIKTFGEIAGRASNVFSAFYNRKEIAQLMKDREEFTKAANADMEKFLNGNFTRFRDALKATRDQSAAPYDTTPLKAFGSTVDETTEKVVKLTEAQREEENYRQQVIKEYADKQMEAIKEDEDYRQQVIKEHADAQMKALKDRIKAEEDAADTIKKANQKASDDYLESVKRNADKVDEENKRMSENLSRSITDGIFRGFENGKGFLRNFLDVLINGLKTAFAQPFIQRLTDMVTPGITGIASSLFGGNSLVASGAGSGFSIGNVLSGLKTSFDAFSGNLVGGVEKLGVMIANGQGGIADAIGGFMGQYSGQITTALAFAPAVFSLLKGDTKGALLSGGGAAIGSLFGPGGAVIGGAIGSLLGGAFGSRPKNPRIGALVSGTYSTATDKYTQTGITKGGAKKLDMTNASAIGQVNQAFLQQLGGYLDAMDVNANIQSGSGFYTKKGKKSIGQLTGSINGKGFAFSEVYGKKDTEAFQKYVNSVLGSVLVSAIQASPLSSGLRALFSGMTDKTQILNMMNATIALNNEQGQLAEKYSITVDQAARVARATGATGNALVDMVNKLAGAVQTTGSVLMQARESLMDGMGGRQLPSTMKAFDDILQSIDKSTQAGIQSFADLFKLREQFAAFTQSIDQLKGGVNSTLMPFLSAQEQQSIKQAELAKVFDSLNMSVPGSLQELIDLGKAIDYTTKEGLDLAAVFPQLVQSFQQTTLETNALIDSLGQLDINKFGTMFEYLRAGSYMRNGISLSQLPSYDVGTSYVPQTGPALIHQGERIMTASENREYSNAMGMVVQEMRMLRQDNASMRAELRSIALSSYKSASSIDRIERDGMIIRDVDQNGDEQIIKVEVVNP